MTFEETKELLYDIKNAKQRAIVIQLRIERLTLQSNSISRLVSNYDGDRVGGKRMSTIEETLRRIDAEIANLCDALQKSFDLEDRLAGSLDCLSPIERDIIVGIYMDCETHDKLAQIFNYDERTIRRKRDKAIMIISSKI